MIASWQQCQKIKLQPSSPPHSDDSDTESDHDETFVREAAVITDKYVSIHNDNKSGSVNIFVSKPHCVVENSESSDEEGDCNGDATVRRALSPNTSSLSPNAKITGMELLNLPVKMPAKDEDSINSLSTTAQKPVQSLPPLVIKHSKVISPPLSAPPVETMSPLLSLSAVKCTSSDEIPLLSTDSVIGVYSQLQLPPEETQKQVLMICCVLIYVVYRIMCIVCNICVFSICICMCIYMVCDSVHLACYVTYRIQNDVEKKGWTLHVYNHLALDVIVSIVLRTHRAAVHAAKNWLLNCRPHGTIIECMFLVCVCPVHFVCQCAEKTSRVLICEILL